MSSKKKHSYITINIPPNLIVKFGETNDIKRRRSQLDNASNIFFIPLVENKENILKEKFKEEHIEKEKYNLSKELRHHINGELETMFSKLLEHQHLLDTYEFNEEDPVPPKKNKQMPIPKSNRAKSSGSPITSQWAYRYYMVKGKKTKYIVRRWKGKIEKIKVK